MRWLLKDCSLLRSAACACSAAAWFTAACARAAILSLKDIGGIYYYNIFFLKKSFEALVKVFFKKIKTKKEKQDLRTPEGVLPVLPFKRAGRVVRADGQKGETGLTHSRRSAACLAP